MPHKLMLWTGRINAFSPGKIDITIKSAKTPAGQALAPDNWDNVMDVKNGKMAWEDYSAWYRRLIYERWKKDPEPFKDLLNRDRVTICCYCNDTEGHKHCHRFLAVDALKWMAGQIGAEIEYMGEAESAPE